MRAPRRRTGTISRPRFPLTRGRRAVLLRRPAVVLVLLLVTTTVVRLELHREQSENATVPLLTAVVAIAPDGSAIAIGPQTDPTTVEFYPGTRVLTPDSAAVLTRTTVTAQDAASSAELAQEQRDWLAAGTVPGAGGEYADMVETALLDIHTLVEDNGAALAGWPQAWRYVWPRDAAFVAVALTVSGHPDDAQQVLEFLQRQQPEDGVFQARYRPDETGVPDARGTQSDGIGWVLWATLRLVRSVPAADRDEVLTTLRPMIDASTRAALRLTDTGDALPPVSQDYWEVPMYRLSLGTAAPIALGLRSAASLQRMLGATTTARSAHNRARKLERSITTEFGAHGYPRELGGDASDASLTFLLPPFTTETKPSVLSAWHRAQRRMARAGGGLAPGVGWRNDGISWTPQTALAALAAAATGDTAAAGSRLTWLAAHRSAYGAIPEKVISTGEAAGPAPLAWTDALVVLSVDLLGT